jgi:DNA-binding LytR/AlgR family response regulator
VNDKGVRNEMDNLNLPMTVIYYDSSNNPSLQVIDIKDVDYIENEGRRLVYHIGDKKYYQIVTKSEMEMFLDNKGFDILDRPYLVNIGKIRHFDEKLGKAYFVDNPSKNSKFVTVARIKMDFVANYIHGATS